MIPAVLLLGLAVMSLAYALERRLAPTVNCLRCAGVGQLQRWHRLTWKTCPRCHGTGSRARRWSR